MTTLQLRPYQSQLIKDTHRKWKEGYRKPLVVLPTGGGKTAVFAWMASQAQANGKTIWFMVHRRELLDQTLETFERFEIPLISIMVDMVSSFAKRIDHGPDLIVVDEAHHTSARTWRRIIDAHPESYVVGLTATPARLDGKPLGEIYDTMVQGPTTADLIDSGFLSPYRYITSEISLGALGVKRGDFDQEEAAEKLMTRAVYGDVIDTYLKYGNGGQAIYFCTTIAHSEEMAEQFMQAGIVAEHFDGKTPKRKRKEIVERFRKGDTQILTNVALVGEGFDLSACSVVGMLRPTQSLTIYLQQAGRALRPAEGKTAVIIDHVGNLNRHGTPSDMREWSLDSVVKTGRKRNKDGSYAIRRCTECMAVYESNTNACPICGTEYQPEQEEIEHMEHIRMVEIDIKKQEELNAYLRSPEAMQSARSYSDLCAIAKARGYKVGWAYIQAKQKGIWVPY